MRSRFVQCAFIAALVSYPGQVFAQAAPQQQPPPPASTPPSTQTAQSHGSVRITLDEAIQLAQTHNHNLAAARTTIQQNEAQEVTANLRPNPVLSLGEQYFPFFQPNAFSGEYIDNNAEFDLGLSYLFERGKKRQHRLQAAQDATAVTRSTVADNERTLIFNVASQFFNVQLAESTLDLALQDQNSFQKTVDISQARYKAGDISEADFLKIQLQLLQFQTDVSQAELSKVQALVGLRQYLGYQSVPEDYDVSGDFDYKPVTMKLEDLQAKALQSRPDFRAAVQGVAAAKSQYELARANGKRDVTGTATYAHTGGVSTLDLSASWELPFFDRNQGEIARTNYAINQAQELELAASDQVMSDVLDAYETVRQNDKVITLYRNGYLDAAQKSLDITQYSYKRGAASLLDFLDAERSYRAAQLGYRQTLAAYLTAVEQLRESVGVRTLP
ncbi:MAG: TolC family protein [Candidatus Acidiferrales bacterium]|jgi:outer membrane protein, heavy metal efflux system